MNYSKRRNLEGQGLVSLESREFHYPYLNYIPIVGDSFPKDFWYGHPTYCSSLNIPEAKQNSSQPGLIVMSDREPGDRLYSDSVRFRFESITVEVLDISFFLEQVNSLECKESCK